MSLLQYFVKAKVVPTPEETGIGKKPTAEANKCVAEVLKWQQLSQSNCKCMATATWKVTDQIDAGKSPDEVVVDMKLTVMKEIGAKWLVSMYE